MTASDPNRKPWYRLRNIALVLVAAVVAAIGWLGFEVWRLHRAKPVISANYRQVHRDRVINDTGVTLVEGERSWIELLETLKVFDRVNRESRVDPHADGFVARFEDDDGALEFSLARLGREIPTNIDRELEAMDVLREQGFFERLHTWSAGPVGLRPVDSTQPMIFDFFPELSLARSTAKMLAARMRLAAVEGDLDETVRCAAAGLAIARTISLQPQMIFGLVGLAMQTLILSELDILLMEHQFTAEQYASLATAVRRNAVAGVPLVLHGERCMFLDTMQHTFTDDGDGDGHIIPRAMEDLGGQSPNGSRFDLRATLNARFLLATRRESLDAYTAFMSQVEQNAMLPPASRLASGFDSEAVADAIPNRQLAFHIFGPSVPRCLRQWYAMDVQREGTLLMIALEAHRAKTGEYPEALDALSPDIPPIDLLDPLTGQSWSYRLLANDPHGRPYLLYSCGYDGNDDGGNSPGDGSRAAIVEPDTRRIDWVVNETRRDKW